MGIPIIVSPERAKRPHEFSLKEKESQNLEEIRTCPFCPGNENLTPEETFRISDKKGNWIIRFFPNKYKIWDFHEVIVDTPFHNVDWNKNENLPKLLKGIRERFLQIEKNFEEIKWLSLFRNYGKFGGASIRHSHLQLIGLTFLPEEIEKLSLKLKKENCFICKEAWKEEVFLFKTKFFRGLFVDGRNPYEIEIHPLRHVTSIKNLSDEELEELAFIFQKIVAIFRNYFVDYNVLFFNSPLTGKRAFLEDFHFFVRIFPRTTLQAGFEFESGIIVNPVGKEKSFEFLGKEFQKAFD